uniref:Protein MON2 homolog n=1 Tax=Arcella intermedia TaxID=1963864 RepID=A0A6B2KXE2_9EUKA
MKRIINIAHQMGNELGEGWSIVLDCLEYLHILLHSGPAVIVSETDEEKEVVGKDELYVLSSSFSSLFTTSHVLSDQGLTVLVEHIDRRARLTLFPIVVEEQELLEQSSESHVKAHLLFGITKLGDIISANMDRIHVVWDLINDFLNLVCNHGNVFVRSEGVATLSRIAEAGLKKQDGQLQRSLLCTMKTLACSQYADVREMTLDEIYNILQSCGHRLSSGWPFVLSIVSVTINPNSKFECKPKHVAKSFNSLRYICSDFLGVLPLDTLAQLITTIGFYGKPMGDINVAITSISGLLWTVSDYLANDVNKREGVSESLKSSLWITLFGQLRIVSLCERHEIRTAALRAMFGILTTHGGVLKPSDWEQTLEILYEMLDGISVLAGEASTDENLQEHQLGQEEDGKPAMMLVHHSRNSAAKQWAETRVIALEGVLRIFQAFFSVLSRDLSDVSKCWKKIMSYIVIYWDSNDIEIALAGVKAVETMLIASSGVDQYPVELWDQGWTTYQKMVSNLTTKEQKVSPQTINIFSVSINNLYQKLKHRMRESDVNLFLSIICPLCSLPVQFAGELSPLRRTVLSIMLECSTQYPSLVPKVTSILLHYNSIAIGYPYNPKCFREPQEQPTVDSPPVTWDISADKLNKLFLPLAELSLKTMKQIWANLYSNQPLQTKIFGDLMHILGRIIQLKFVSYESTIWLEAIALFLMVMEEGTTIFVSNDSNLVELNVIWNDITDSIDSFLFHQSPNVATDMAQLSRDEHLDIFMCKALLLLLNQPTVVPNLRDRLVSTLIEGTNIKTEGREQVSRCCWSLLFSLINFPPPPLPRPHKLLTEKIPTSPKSGPLSGQFNKATPPVPDSPTKTTLITINSVAHLIAPKLIDLCQSVIRSFIADEKKGPIDRRRVSEVSFLLEQLSNLNLNPTIKLSSGTGGIALIKYLFPVLVECITSNEASVRTSLQKLFLLISNDICNNVQ